MSKPKPVNYHVGTFRESLIAYSKDRRRRDPEYRQAFIESRKQKAQVEEKSNA